MCHQGAALENLPSLAQRELARACDALYLMVASLTVALSHLYVCVLHVLRAVAINGTMRLHPCREAPCHEVHVRSHIRYCNKIPKRRKEPLRGCARSTCAVACLSVASSHGLTLHAALMQS
jgi:hypothetical protein